MDTNVDLRGLVKAPTTWNQHLHCKEMT